MNGAEIIECITNSAKQMPIHITPVGDSFSPMSVGCYVRNILKSLDVERQWT